MSHQREENHHQFTPNTIRRPRITEENSDDDQMSDNCESEEGSGSDMDFVEGIYNRIYCFWEISWHCFIDNIPVGAKSQIYKTTRSILGISRGSDTSWMESLPHINEEEIIDFHHKIEKLEVGFLAHYYYY
jgi:hypothetical protein